MAELSADGVRVNTLDAGVDLPRLEPRLSLPNANAQPIRAAFHLPDEAQIRNPDHLRALIAACRKSNVTLREATPVTSIHVSGDRVASVETERETIAAAVVIITAGAWSEPLLESLGLTRSIYPVRGQMILFRCDQPPISHIINEGPRYMVPRDDGRLLVGSTEEDVGFDKSTTDEGMTELQAFAREWLPELDEAKIEATWAGLRPHAVDGFPFIGRAGHLQNCFVAAGHYRAGLSTSTSTALLMRQLILGEPLEMEIGQFGLDR